jgi:thiamine biosynthesis lipoprotein
MISTCGPVTFPAIGTTAVLVTWPADAQPAARLVLEEEIEAIDRACSRFRHDSELSAVNRAGGQWVPATSLFLEAVETALAAARRSRGAVDPTLGVTMRLLGYDRDYAEIPPDGPPLGWVATPAPAWRQVGVDRSRRRVRVPAGAELDLGATAKALAADRAVRRSADLTGAGVLVNLGGDVAATGVAPPGGWRVHVTDDHRSSLDAPGQTVSIEGGGLATSSTTTRRWRRGGEVLHHVVNPATRLPASGPWRTVSVAAANCVDANTAATAALVIGAGAPEWLEAQGLPARLVAGDGTVLAVAGWPPGGQ